MTVSFRTRIIDIWYCFSHLITTTITGRCVLALFLAAPAVLPALAILWSVPGSKMQHMMMLLFFPVIGGFYLAFTLGGIIGAWLSSVLMPKTKITIDSQFCYRKDVFAIKSSWRAFLTLTEEADYYFFTGWWCVFYIPKAAFEGHAEADAFYQTALGFWRKAKGLPAPTLVPDTIGSWPPSPRPGNSAEPGGGREC